MLCYSDLVVAFFEALAGDPGTAASTGRFYLNTTSHVVKWYANSAWHTAMDCDTAQTATNKTFTSPTINSGTLATPVITSYAELAEAAAPSTPASGYGRLYATTTGKLKYVNDDGITVEMGSSSGVGEKNYCTNPSGVADVAAAVPTGWANVGDVDIVVTKTAADLPREYTTTAGLKITADANTQSTADYVYYDFTLDDVDLNKKLKIQWSQKTTGTYNAGDLAVIITTQADRTTAVATPVTTAIPAADGVFTTSFDTGSTATLSLVIRATTDMTTNGGIVISDVVIGPGIQPQGAVVGEWITYTPAVANLGAGSYTSYGKWRRVGDSMELLLYFAKDVTPGTGASEVTIALPSGYDIDSTKVTNNIQGTNFGSAYRHRNIMGAVTGGGGTTQLRIIYVTRGDCLQGQDVAASDIWHIRATTPIAQWSGSGTLNVAQNDVEWAADDGSSDVFGPNGALVPNEAAAVSTSTRVFTFQTTPQAGDQYVLELKPSGYNWQNAVDKYPFSGGNNSNSNNYYGVRGYWSSATQYTVEFGLRGTCVSASNVDNGTTSWATEYAAGTRFRVRKASAGAAVGFGKATQSSLGLVKAGQVPGTNTNDSADTGNVGEEMTQTRLRSAATGLTTATAANVTATAITLTAGDWDVSGIVGFTTSSSTITSVEGAVATTSATMPGNDVIGVPTSNQCRVYKNIAFTTTSIDYTVEIPSYRVSVASSTTIYLVARAAFSAGTVSAFGSFRARRVR